MFEIRGVLEGFYGRPWAWAERRSMLEFMAANNFNAFFYGPKNEPLHRNRWREPYLPQEMARFGRFAEACRASGVSFVFGLSPLEFHYSSEEDLSTLLSKLHAAREVGITEFMLLMDDMPERFRYPEDGEKFGTLAAAQAWLCNRLKAEAPGRLYFCPTEYHGAGDSAYLRELGEKLNSEIEVFWTGREVCSSALETEDAKVISATLRRSVLYWDNYPVNDLEMRFHPHLRPYRGRDADLETASKGIVLNAALQPEASKIVLHTAAQYFANPTDYEPESAWPLALEEVCGNLEDAQAVKTLSDLARHNSLEPGKQLENSLRPVLEGFFDGYFTAEKKQQTRRVLEHLQATAERIKIMSNLELSKNLEPWTLKLEGWARVALMGVEILEHLDTERIEELLDEIARVRENFHWVAGDQFEVFARKCARVAMEASR